MARWGGNSVRPIMIKSPGAQKGYILTQIVHHPVLIIGSGPAGHTAGIYAARAALNPLLVQGMQPGGQLTITTDVENWPGESSIQGPALMEKMAQHSEHAGTTLINDTILSVDLSRHPFEAQGDSGTLYRGDALIIATGAQARWLGLPSEDIFRGFGVSACATCDGFFYRGRKVAVVGGGNTAAEEALFLTNFASEVVLIHRRDSLRADKVNQQRVLAHPKITPVWNSEVEEILGSRDPAAVTGLRVVNRTNGAKQDIAVDGLFVAIGHDPATHLFKGQLDMDEDGYIRVDAHTTRTSIPGVFAAGDVVDKVYRQAITSAGMGCMAALDAERFLAHQGVT